MFVACMLFISDLFIQLTIEFKIKIYSFDIVPQNGGTRNESFKHNGEELDKSKDKNTDEF